MDRETQKLLFEPFFTTKEVGKGTGLGLSTVYGIVKQNNGFLTVYSEPGLGSTFTIYIPKSREDSAGAQPAGAENPGHGNGETVLLVEDEPALLNMTLRILEKLGYSVISVTGPNDAIRVAGEYDGTIHLLITDVVMPGMNGHELAKRLITHRPGLKILFMSGYTADVIAHQGKLTEGIHFIQKPFSTQELAIHIRETLDV
jgi:CheY-like chemotaxis protein